MKSIHYATASSKDSGEPLVWLSLDGESYHCVKGPGTPEPSDYDDVAALFGPQKTERVDRNGRPVYMTAMTVARRALGWLSDDVVHHEPIVVE